MKIGSNQIELTNLDQSGKLQYFEFNVTKKYPEKIFINNVMSHNQQILNLINDSYIQNQVSIEIKK